MISYKTSVHTSSGYFGIDSVANTQNVKSCCLTKGDYPTQSKGGVEGFTKGHTLFCANQ